MGEIMNSPNGIKSDGPERVRISAHMWHPSRFTEYKWKPVRCHSM